MINKDVRAENSDNLVGTLVGESFNILFSSASQGKNGEHHINEQPLEYWDEKFAKHGYKRTKNFKEDLQGISGIDPWYVNNTCLYQLKRSNTLGLRNE